jgi:hypothetical protein
MGAAAPSIPLPAVSERIAAVIFVLCQTLTMRVRGATATVTPAQLTYIVGRLLGMRKRFNRLVELIHAGKPPRERTRKPRAQKPPPDPAFPLGFRPPPKGWRRWAVHPNKPVPLWRSLRQHTFGWLLPLAPNVVGFRESAVWHRAQLLGLLAEPETQALLRASRHVGDTLRPLCWMLAIETSLLYPAPPPAPAAVVSTPDPSDPAPGHASGAARSAENPMPSKNEVFAVATPRPFMASVIEPLPRAREGDDFFAMA